MEKQKLPNQTAVMILAIISFIGCCCTNGVLGLIFAAIGLFLANKDEKLQAENPDVYDIGSLKTWKVVNIISLVISSLFTIYLIYTIVTGQFEENMNQFNEIMDQLKNQ